MTYYYSYQSNSNKLIPNNEIIFRLLVLLLRILYIKNYVINYTGTQNLRNARLSRKTAALRVSAISPDTVQKKYLISNYEFNPSSRKLVPRPPRRGRDRRSHPRRFRPCLTSLCLGVSSSFCPPRGSCPYPSSSRQLHLALHLSNTFLDRKLIKFSNSHKSATFFNLRLHKLAGTYRQRGKPRL